jgi:hypothetical protein
MLNRLTYPFPHFYVVFYVWSMVNRLTYHFPQFLCFMCDQCWTSDRSTGSTTFSRTEKTWRVGYERWIWSFVAATRFRNLQKSSLSCWERVTPQLFIWFHWSEVIDPVDPPLYRQCAIFSILLNKIQLQWMLQEVLTFFKNLTQYHFSTKSSFLYQEMLSPRYYGHMLISALCRS